jgi:acid phosphatase
MRAVARKGKLLTNYRALGHPAQMNYIGAIAGSTFNIRDNDAHQLNVSNIVDLLENAGVSWKAYAKNFPGPCFNGEFNQKTYVQSEYFRFTNPFMSMNNIRRNPFRCAKIVDAATFKNDYQTGRLPLVSWYIPNAYESGLKVNVQTSAQWLSSFLRNKLNNAAFMNNTAIFVTFDQSNVRFPDKDPLENNHVWAVAFGRAFSTINTALNYNHYSILSTLEANWNLPTLRSFNTNTTLNDLFSPPLSPMNPI